MSDKGDWASEPSDGASVAWRRVILEQVPLAMRSTLAGYGMATDDIEVRADWLGELLAVQVKDFILAQTLEEHKATYPSDWWQALKERWFPKWALRRWPVRHTTVELKAQALYPSLVLPKEPHVFRSMLMVDERA
uniref:Uncharacterized protein n=1 Tax=viral metagenome TaxID=1070528 RepID=A0A6M3L0X3_9ZZZZ